MPLGTRNSSSPPSNSNEFLSKGHNPPVVVGPVSVANPSGRRGELWLFTSAGPAVLKKKEG